MKISIMAGWEREAFEAILREIEERERIAHLIALAQAWCLAGEMV